MNEDYDLLDFLYNVLKRNTKFASAMEIRELLQSECKNSITRQLHDVLFALRENIETDLNNYKNLVIEIFGKDISEKVLNDFDCFIENRFKKCTII